MILAEGVEVNFIKGDNYQQKKSDFRTDLHFSSKKEDWETPKELFLELHQRFGFDLDAAASEQNAKLEKYYTKEDDALLQKWEGNVFCNPPYKRGGTLFKWVSKAYEEYKRDPNRVIVLLIPARTETKYFHDLIFGKATVEFLKGRLKFEIDGIPHPHNAPFPSAIVIYGKKT